MVWYRSLVVNASDDHQVHGQVAQTQNLMWRALQVFNPSDREKAHLPLPPTKISPIQPQRPRDRCLTSISDGDTEYQSFYLSERIFFTRRCKYLEDGQIRAGREEERTFLVIPPMPLVQKGVDSMSSFFLEVCKKYSCQHSLPLFPPNTIIHR